MPYSIRRSRGGGYNIMAKKGGRWTKVGHSSSKAKAGKSIGIRRRAEKKR